MQQLLADKREREKRVVTQMIQLYCSKQHHNGATLCKECSCLLSYANERIEHCPFIKEKTFCSNCRVHCYQPQMREQIRQVMRYAGPRICCIIRCWQCAIWLRVDGRKTDRREKDEVQASHLPISGVFGLCAGSSWSCFTIAAKLSVFDVGGVVFCQKFAEAAQLVCPYQSV